MCCDMGLAVTEWYWTCGEEVQGTRFQLFVIVVLTLLQTRYCCVLTWSRVMWQTRVAAHVAELQSSCLHHGSRIPFSLLVAFFNLLQISSLQLHDTRIYGSMAWIRRL